MPTFTKPGFVLLGLAMRGLGMLAILTLAVGACAQASPTPATPSPLPSLDGAPVTATPSPGSSGFGGGWPFPAPSSGALPAFAPDAPLLLYSNTTTVGGGIFVMRPDGSGATRLATDVLPGVHKRPAWSPDGESVVFADETTERLYVAHLDGSPTTLLPVCAQGGCDWPRWSPDGRRIAYSEVEGSKAGLDGPGSIAIKVLDVATGRVTEAVRLERPVLADVPTWSPDGTRIAFEVDQMDDQANETGASIGVVSATGGPPRYLTSFDGFATTPDWGWATNQIAFATDLIGLKKVRTPGDDTWDLWVVDPDSTAPPRPVTHEPAANEIKSPLWTADGKALAAYDITAHEGAIVDVATGAITPFPMAGFPKRAWARPVTGG
jgi:Tol biopolymer transport system component